MRRVFYDCEFHEDGSTIDLISIGLVDDDGREFYGVSADFDQGRVLAHPWLRENVWPHLPLFGDGDMASLDKSHPDVYPRDQLRAKVLGFLDPSDNPDDLELWGYYSAYDHVVLSQLWGTMLDRPAGVPMWTRDLMDLWETCGRPLRLDQGDAEHNALADARWNRLLWQACLHGVREARYAFVLRPGTVGVTVDRPTFGTRDGRLIASADPDLLGPKFEAVVIPGSLGPLFITGDPNV